MQYFCVVRGGDGAKGVARRVRQLYSSRKRLSPHVFSSVNGEPRTYACTFVCRSFLAISSQRLFCLVTGEKRMWRSSTSGPGVRARAVCDSVYLPRHLRRTLAVFFTVVPLPQGAARLRSAAVIESEHRSR